jgi:hypothetical protein
VRNEFTLGVLVSELVNNCGDEFTACRAAGVSPMFLAQWRKDDPIIDEKIVEASRVGAMSLKSEAIRRAVHGDEKGIYFKGEKVGSEYVKSDGLLQTLLKTLPEFQGESEAARNVFHGPVQINNNMPRAANYEEWLAMKDATLKRRADQEALPAPDAPIDAEFTEVAPSPFASLQGVI